MKILVIAPNWIGDAVMSLSLLQAMKSDEKRRFSDGRPCEIHVLAPPATAPVYRFSSAADTVQAEPFTHSKLQLSLRRRVGQALACEHFDQAVVLPNSLKSALVPWFASVESRVGYSGELRSAVLTHCLPKPPKQAKPPMIEWYGSLGGYSRAQLQFPVMQVQAADAEQACHEHGFSRSFLALAPGAEFGPAKRWPAAHFARVASEFLQLNAQQNVVVLGGPKDAGFGEEILSHIPQALQGRAMNLAGKTSLVQAVQLMSAACALVTNDSGLMHVAAALDVQVHAVFGSSSPEHTPPLNAGARVYTLNLPCSPCFQRECPLGHTDCLKKLDPKTVIAQLPRTPAGV